jgi:hypothetical protein
MAKRGRKPKNEIITCVVDTSKLGPDEPLVQVKSIPVDPLSIPFVPQPKHKVLFQDELREVRLYPPCKRTMAVNGRPYYLPLPHLIFLKRVVPPKTKYSSWNQRSYSEGMTNLFMGFTTADAQKIYHIPLAGVSGFCVCLDSVLHYDFPVNSTFDELLKTFWRTNFSGDYCSYRRVNVFGGRLHEWQKLTLQQVENDLPLLEKFNGGYTYTLDQFKELKQGH